MASLTSESDSNTFAREIQYHLLYSFFSLTTDMNRDPRNPRVPAVLDSKRNYWEVRVHYFFASGYLSIPFRLQSMAALKEGDQWQMWEFIPI